MKDLLRNDTHVYDVAVIRLKDLYHDNTILPPGMGLIKLPGGDDLPNMNEKAWSLNTNI